jgi:Haemolysin-III related
MASASASLSSSSSSVQSSDESSNSSSSNGTVSGEHYSSSSAGTSSSRSAESTSDDTSGDQSSPQRAAKSRRRRRDGARRRRKTSSDTSQNSAHSSERRSRKHRSARRRAILRERKVEKDIKKWAEATTVRGHRRRQSMRGLRNNNDGSDEGEGDVLEMAPWEADVLTAPTSFGESVLDFVFGIFPIAPRFGAVHEADVPRSGPTGTRSRDVESGFLGRREHESVTVPRLVVRQTPAPIPLRAQSLEMPSPPPSPAPHSQSHVHSPGTLEAHAKSTSRGKCGTLRSWWYKFLIFFEGEPVEFAPRTSFSMIGYPGINPDMWPPDHLSFGHMLLLWLPFSRYGPHFESVNLFMHMLAFLFILFGLYWFVVSPAATFFELFIGETGSESTQGLDYQGIKKWPVLTQLSFSAFYLACQVAYHWYNVHSDTAWRWTMNIMTIAGAVAGVLLELPYLEYSFCNSAAERHAQYGVYFASITIGYAVVRWRRWMRPDAYIQRTVAFLIVGLFILFMKGTVNIVYLDGDLWDVAARSALVLVARSAGAYVNSVRFPETFSNRPIFSYFFTSSQLLLAGGVVGFSLDFANSVSLIKFAVKNCAESGVATLP